MGRQEGYGERARESDNADGQRYWEDGRERFRVVEDDLCLYAQRDEVAQIDVHPRLQSWAIRSCWVVICMLNGMDAAVAEDGEFFA